LAAATGLSGPDDWVWLNQVHGTAVQLCDGPTPSGNPPEGDAAVTAVVGLPLAVVTADCAPVVLATSDAVGVVHAGHRGLYDGVVEAAIASLRSLGDDNVSAFLAPCIRAARYEFGDADLQRFVARFGPGVAGRTHEGRPALDLAAALHVILVSEGVAQFADCGICTADSPEYFSYRRDGATGRQATIAMLT
jgi:YfiH family protein